MSAKPAIKSIAIIGTAGRRDDAARINADLYARMAGALKEILQQTGPVQRMVSGGAAVADHLAVGFFLKGLVPQLSLHLPAMFALSTARYVEPYKKSAGSISNYWHQEFSRKCGGNSLKALAEALRRKECSQKVHFGFDQRNGGIAEEADAVVAFTFGSGPQLKPGGSFNTMSLCLSRGIPSWHVDLNTMQVFSPAAATPAGGGESD